MKLSQTSFCDNIKGGCKYSVAVMLSVQSGAGIYVLSTNCQVFKASLCYPLAANILCFARSRVMLK